MSVRLRALGLVAAVALLSSGLLTTSSAGAATPAPLSQGRPVTASSSGGCCPAENAVDGKSGTRWASAAGPGPQWIDVDLGFAAQLTRVRLEWDASCATQYRIETSFDRVAWTTVSSTTTGKGGVEDLTVGGAGRYVRAVLLHRCRDVAGKGYSLRELQVFGQSDLPPDPPGNVRLGQVTCTSAEIHWDPPVNFTPVAYDIFIDGQLRLSVPGNVTRAVITGLTPNLSYGVFVVARDAAGNSSPPSAAVVVITPPCPEPTPPPAPANVHLISIAGNCVTIGWTGDAAGYHVYELTGGSRVQVAGSTTNTATICGLNLSTFYLFVVTAVDAAGNESAPSGPLQVVLPPVPCDTAPVCGVDTVTTSTAVGNTQQDELNLITRGGNYGWPRCEGTLGDCAGSVPPVRTFAPPAASPGGIAIVKGVIYMTALRGQRLYRMVITGTTVAPPTVLFPGIYGRLRTVEPAPDGGLWLTTSNGDGIDHTPVDKVLHVSLA